MGSTRSLSWLNRRCVVWVGVPALLASGCTLAASAQNQLQGGRTDRSTSQPSTVTPSLTTPAFHKPLSGRPATSNPPTLSTSTQPAPPKAPTTSPSPAASAVLAASGTRLTLGGVPYRDVGVNAYEIATYWGINSGCGSMLTDYQLDQFFASLPVHSLIRFWAWQGSMAINVHTGQLDWRPLDRVVNAAATHNDLLIVSLASPDGSCDDDHWKDSSWYEGGFRSSYGPNLEGVTSIPYWSYVQQIVSRYAGSPAIGMWEPMSEPEGSSCQDGYRGHGCEDHQTCVDEAAAASALRHFYDLVGQEIHTLDPRHLVEAGFVGSGQCGTSYRDFANVGASPGIDVLSYHEYYPPEEPLGGDQWNGLVFRSQQATAVGKPLIAGEMGVPSGTGAGCVTPAARESYLKAKISAQSNLGVAVFLLWNWEPTASVSCSFDMLPGDPALGLIGET